MIYISVGHGSHGKDPGAVANGTNEFTECSAVASLLEKMYGMKMIPRDLTLKERIVWVNTHLTSSDVLIELHMDAATPVAKGATVFYREGNIDMGKSAQKFLSAYCAFSGTSERYVLTDAASRFGRLGIIRDVKCKPLLIELGFITNVADLSMVRANAANAIIRAINSTFITTPSMDTHESVPEWMQDACDWIKLTGISTGDRPLDTMKRGEVFELLRKLTIYLNNKYEPGAH